MIKSILLSVDGSIYTESAVRNAAHLARALDAIRAVSTTLPSRKPLNKSELNRTRRPTLTSFFSRYITQFPPNFRIFALATAVSPKSSPRFALDEAMRKMFVLQIDAQSVTANIGKVFSGV